VTRQAPIAPFGPDRPRTGKEPKRGLVSIIDIGFFIISRIDDAVAALLIASARPAAFSPPQTDPHPK
jgi:hypothetical protein